MQILALFSLCTLFSKWKSFIFWWFLAKFTLFSPQNLKVCLQSIFIINVQLLNCFSFFVVCIFPFFQFFVFQVFSFHFQFFPSVSVNVECMKLQLMLQFRKKEGRFKFFVSSSKWWSLLFSNLTYMNYDNPKSDHTDRK